MGRRDFGSMLDTIDKPTEPAATQDTTASSTPKAKSRPARAAAKTPTPKAPADKSPSSASTTKAAGGVGYDLLERKEVRLHDHQVETLASLARRLNKQRGGEGHRITENTLIRLAIDLLLQRADDLDGKTEEALAESLNLPK